MTVRYLTAAESWGRGLRSGAELLKPYRGRGRVRLTDYERFYLWESGPLAWRLIVINERFEAVVVGPEFESKAEALQALPGLARSHDCQKR